MNHQERDYLNSIIAERDEARQSLATYKSALSGTQKVRDDYKARAVAAGAERDELERLRKPLIVALAQAEAEVQRLREALRRGCDETDYCYVCDCHPSHGHAKDCALCEHDGRPRLPRTPTSLALLSLERTHER